MYVDKALGVIRKLASQLAQDCNEGTVKFWFPLITTDN